MLAVSPVIALTGPTLSLTPTSNTLSRGSEVSVTVNLKDCEKCKSLALVFDYDTDNIFEIVSGEWLLSGTLLASFDKTTTKAGTAAAAYMNETDANGDIFVLKLKVKDNAPAGDATVTVTPTIKNGSQAISCSATSLKLNIQGTESGKTALTATADKETATGGSEVTVTVNLKDCEKCKSLALVFDYDTDNIFEIVSGEWLLSGTLLASFDKTTTKAGTAAAAYMNETDANGDIFVLKLKVKDNAPAGDATITVTPTIKNGSMTIPCAVALETVKITKVCKHTQKTLVPEQNSTCETQGWDAYYQCDDCNQIFLSDGTTEVDEIPFRPLGNHTGGEATCKNLAVCSVCHNSYGSLNPDNHKGEKETRNKVTPTCGKDGYTGDVYCLDCNKKVSSGKTDPATGNHTGGTATCKDKAICDVCHQPYGGYGAHSLTQHDRNEPDHYNTGNIQYWTCDVCNKYFSDYEGKNEIKEKDTVLEIVPHSYPETWVKSNTQHWKECGCGNKIEVADHSYDNACDTTCNVCGYKRSITHSYQQTWSTDGTQHWHECSVCHDKKDIGTHSGGTATCKAKAICEICKQSYGDLGGHSLTPHARNEADHFKAGNIQYWTCDVCNKYFSDAEGKTEITEQDTVIPKIEHSYSLNWSKNDTKHWKECSCGDKISEEEHSYDNACDTTCNVCGYVRSITHSYQQTWSTDGTQHWHECSVCHDKKDVGTHSGGTATCKAKAICEICNQPYGNLGGHSYSEIVNNECLKSAATCVSPAVYYKSCSVCGTKSNETFTYGSVDKTNHTGGTYLVGQKEASCFEEGYTGDTHCSGCDTKLESGQIIEKNNHNPASVWSTDAEYHWKECQTIGCGNLIDKAAHSGGEATCISKAVCEVCHVEYGKINPNNHKNTTVINAKPATEDEEGYTGDTYCLDCKKTVQTGKTIEKLDHTHNMVATSAKESTCTATGNIAYWYCTKCQKYYSDANGINEITLEAPITEKKNHSYTVLQHDDTNHWYKCANCSATTGIEVHSGGTATCKDLAVCEKCHTAYGNYVGHNYVETVDAKYLKAAATCKDLAVYYKSCSVCGEKGVETFTTGTADKTNHTGGTYLVGQKEASCYEEGYTGDTYCSGCDAKLQSGQVVGKTSHNPASVWSTDAEYHWKECQTVGCGNKIDKAAHSGGEATCISKAVCEVCHVEYGEINPNNHKNTTVINAKPETCYEEGYTGDTYCNYCKKVVANGMAIQKTSHTASDWKFDEDEHWKVCTVEKCGVEIAESRGKHTESDWIIDKPATFTEEGSKHIECTVCGKVIKTESIAKLIAYEITVGANGTWTKGSKDDLSFTSNAEFSKFVEVKVDGKVIDTNNYNAKTGSTEITLKNDFLETLSAGKHTLTIVSTDGYAETTFEIKEAEKPVTPVSPQTGDNSNLILWISLLIVSLGGLVTLSVPSKKRKVR